MNLYIHFQFLLLRMKGGDLFDRVAEKPLTENEAKHVVKSILSGIQYLHTNNIVHRDLKPENIMMVDNGSTDIKITDFGLSRIVDEKGEMSTLCGTPQYMAPEILLRMKYSSKADIWSIGVIAYVILSGRHPFNGPKINDILKKIQAGPLDFSHPVWASVSPLAKDLIRFILVIDPEKRPSVDEVLAHKWFTAPTDGNDSANPDSNENNKSGESGNDDGDELSLKPPQEKRIRKNMECNSATF